MLKCVKASDVQCCSIEFGRPWDLFHGLLFFIDRCSQNGYSGNRTNHYAFPGGHRRPSGIFFVYNRLEAHHVLSKTDF